MATVFTDADALKLIQQSNADVRSDARHYLSTCSISPQTTMALIYVNRNDTLCELMDTFSQMLFFPPTRIFADLSSNCNIASRLGNADVYVTSGIFRYNDVFGTIAAMSAFTNDDEEIKLRRKHLFRIKHGPGSDNRSEEAAMIFYIFHLQDLWEDVTKEKLEQTLRTILEVDNPRVPVMSESNARFNSIGVDAGVTLSADCILTCSLGKVLYSVTYPEPVKNIKTTATEMKVLLDDSPITTLRFCGAAYYPISINPWHYVTDIIAKYTSLGLNRLVHPKLKYNLAVANDWKAAAKEFPFLYFDKKDTSAIFCA